MNEPICPVCGSDIERIDTIDSYEDVNSTEYFCVGECPTCGKGSQWREVYTFSHIKDLEECKGE